MKLDKEHWKELDLNVDSLWIMGPRAKGGKHSNMYHGNFAPQIPNEMIRRYTEENGIVLDMFMGSGTTLYECESLNRNFIGFDINQDVIDFVNQKMDGLSPITYRIHNCNILDSESVSSSLAADLKELNAKKLDLVMSHPPYWDIIKFTDKPYDLSNIESLDDFLDAFELSVKNVWPFIKKNGYFVLVAGDIYRDSAVIPLAFLMMERVRKGFKSWLKGIVIKDMVGNRAKIGIETIWRYRALKNGNFLFKHEYIFVFRKK